MKGLTIEQKAKAYDEAIEVARKYWNSPRTCIDIDVLPELFPEIKELDDEEIRKELISMCQTLGKEEWIAWLEKQGEQKPADMVEQKFQIGDWVVDGLDSVYQIKEIKENKYFLQFYDSHDVISIKISTIDNDCHLWTIEDAKDGDVLSYRNGQWIFIYKEKIDDNSFYYHTLYSTIRQDLIIDDIGFTLLDIAIVPATKEQRDLLFQKMKEAGYEWDADKKELKKVEQKPAEWSKEDERLFQIIIDILDKEEHKGHLSHVDLIACVRKLKSLRPQKQWRPSEMEMKALEFCLEHNIDKDGVFGSKVVKLYDELKKLKG